jgi:hypothetical protein
LNETSPVSHPVEDLISIVIVYSGTDPQAFVSRLDTDLKTRYEKVRVIVALMNDLDLKSENEKLEIVFSKKLSQSKMWSKLIQMVSTDFVLVGKDIEVLNAKV